ncbi:hypothetical protein FRC12_022854 [Ceratobasidium sp. 428]|nr:hypothetical protein FRC12_022854 [Ceratobasidium sp. 428]
MNGRKTKGGIVLGERESEAMGEDMVKILKSQDEGYLRTVKSKGRKRIDAIRSELTAMVDVIPSSEDAEDLDEDVVETLCEAGVLPPINTSRKGKSKTSQPNPRHIVFVDDEAAAKQYAGPSTTKVAEAEWDSEDGDLNFGSDEGEEDEYASQRAQKQEAKRKFNAKKHRLALLEELSARLKRDTALRHAIRELEMQRHLMAPGARTKIRGPERAEADEDEDEDVGGRKETKRGQVKFARQGEVDYKPRVYKWRSERKR